MKNPEVFSKMQKSVLLTLRLLTGWSLLYEGISKLFQPGWSSLGFLEESQWILSGFAGWVINNGSVLNLLDFLNVWGLMFIGTGLILGLFTRVASISGAILLFLYFLNNIPLIGLEYSMPTEGNYLIVSKTLIEVFALLVLAVFPSGRIWGLDMIIPQVCNRRLIHKE